MNISLNTLLEEANNQIKRLTYKETVSIIDNKPHVIIDVREESEVQSLGLIKNAINIPRGVIEFKLAPNSLHNPITIMMIHLFLFIVLVVIVLLWLLKL